MPMLRETAQPDPGSCEPEHPFEINILLVAEHGFQLVPDLIASLLNCAVEYA